MTASATDSDGTVGEVDFAAVSGGVTIPIGVAKAAPYTINWIGSASGTYALTATAIDNDGGTVASSAVSITVGTGLSTNQIACGDTVTGALTTSDGTSVALGNQNRADHYNWLAVL